MSGKTATSVVTETSLEVTLILTLNFLRFARGLIIKNGLMCLFTLPCTCSLLQKRFKAFVVQLVMFLLYQRVAEASFCRIFVCILFTHGSGTMSKTVSLTKSKHFR